MSLKDKKAHPALFIVDRSGHVTEQTLKIGHCYLKIKFFTNSDQQYNNYKIMFNVR